MDRSDYEGGLQSFEHARAQMRHYGGRPLLLVSLVSFPMGVLQRFEIAHRLWQISGWKFDDLDITIRQRLCEAFYAAGRMMDAGESLLKMVNTLDEQSSYMSGSLTKWISGEFMLNSLVAVRLKLLHRFHPHMPVRSRR
jgi:hypothetical protein